MSGPSSDAARVQLMTRLRHHPSGTPATPADAIRGFLEALGVPPDRMPARQDAQARYVASVAPNLLR